MRKMSIGTALLAVGIAALGERSFAPLESWKAAVASGNQAAIGKLYRWEPEAATQAGTARIAVREEIAFWVDMKGRGLAGFKPRVLEVNPANGVTHVVMRISADSAGKPVYIIERQDWARGPDGWKIVASRRAAAFAADPTRTLPQPAAPNTSLYSDPKDAENELKAALARAGKEGKRVIVMFGGNWCYDCHVLDTTFHSAAFAPLMAANFIVVHINIGDEGTDNHELAARLGVALDKGVPSLGVLDPDGKVVYAQTNGEFEATEKIGAQDVRAFLEKWKPRGE
jgi:thioredoxin 1